MYVAPGTYRVAFGGMLQSHPTLSTGIVAIDVKEPTAAEEEAFTAWGQEVGGLHTPDNLEQVVDHGGGDGHLRSDLGLFSTCGCGVWVK